MLLPAHKERHEAAWTESPPLPCGNNSSCVCCPTLARIYRESPNRKINLYTCTMPFITYPLAQLPPASQVSPWPANGASKPWEQQRDPHVTTQTYLCGQTVVLSSSEQTPFRGNSITALNLPLPSAVQTPALSVLQTERLLIIVTHKNSATNSQHEL